MPHPVTVAIINYKTSDLIRQTIESFRSYHPQIPLLLIDNGSKDESTIYLKQLAETSSEPIELIINENNLHHGPAMDQALQHASSPYVLFIDSDCEVCKGGFIDLMITHLQAHPDNYIVGKKIYMNKRGFDVEASNSAIEYIRPICMLVKREIYLKLPKFVRHGTPCLDNMKTAVERGYRLIDFPIDEFIWHLGRGTARRYGYQLGWRGRLNYLLNRLGL